MHCAKSRPLGKSNNSNKNEESNTPTKFENHLLSIRDERQTMIHPNSHPT